MWCSAMPKATEHQAQDRLAMLQCVYEDNLRLGERRRRRPRLRLLSHPRRRSTWALLGITLMFGPALGYLGPSVFVDGPETRQSSAVQLSPTQPETLQTEQTAHSLTYFPFVPAELDFAMLDGPGQFPATEPARWSDFDMLLRDDRSPLTAVFGLDVKTIVLDPGHGGTDSGAIGGAGYDGKGYRARYRLAAARPLTQFRSVQDSHDPRCGFNPAPEPARGVRQ